MGYARQVKIKTKIKTKKGDVKDANITQLDHRVPTQVPKYPPHSDILIIFSSTYI